jgi:hypothetical protein
MGGWMDACYSVDTIEGLRAQLDGMRRELQDPAHLKSIYQFAFDFGKEPAQKSLRTRAPRGPLGTDGH